MVTNDYGAPGGGTMIIVWFLAVVITVPGCFQHPLNESSADANRMPAAEKLRSEDGDRNLADGEPLTEPNAMPTEQELRREERDSNPTSDCPENNAFDSDSRPTILATIDVDKRVDETLWRLSDEDLNALVLGDIKLAISPTPPALVRSGKPVRIKSSAHVIQVLDRGWLCLIEGVAFLIGVPQTDPAESRARTGNRPFDHDIDSLFMPLKAVDYSTVSGGLASYIPLAPLSNSLVASPDQICELGRREQQRREEEQQRREKTLKEYEAERANLRREEQQITERLDRDERERFVREQNSRDEIARQRAEVTAIRDRANARKKLTHTIWGMEAIVVGVDGETRLVTLIRTGSNKKVVVDMDEMNADDLRWIGHRVKLVKEYGPLIGEELLSEKETK